MIFQFVLPVPLFPCHVLPHLAGLPGHGTQTRIIRLPGHVHNFLRSLERSSKEFAEGRGKAPTDHELSEEVGAAVEKIQVCAWGWIEVG